MTKTDKEVLELCKSWFEDIMERSDRLTSGNVAHGRAAIRGVAKSYAEFIAEHLKDRWKPSDEQMHYLSWIANIKLGDSVVEQEVSKHLNELLEDLKKLREE